MKRILYIMLATMSVVMLAACTSQSKVSITNDFFNSITQTQDVEKANSLLASNMKQDLDFGLTEEAKEETEPEYLKFEENLKKFSKLTKHTSIEEDGKVKVTLEYADLATPIEDAFNEHMTEELENILDGIETPEKESEVNLYKKINEKLASITPEMKKVEGFVEFTEESGDTLISNIDEILLTGLSYGLGEIEETEE